MAYDYAGTKPSRNSMPIPAEPAVLCVPLNNDTADANVLVYVPWKNCRLSYCYTVVTTAIDNNSDLVLTLELNAEAGSTMAVITIAQNSGVGTIDTPTLTAANCRKLDRDDSTRDAINIDVNGDASPAGQVMLYMYFESDYEV